MVLYDKKYLCMVLTNTLTWFYMMTHTLTWFYIKMLTTNMVIFCVHIHIDCERTRKGEVKVGLKACSWAEGPAASRQAKPNVCALSALSDAINN